MAEAYIYDHVRTPRGRGKKDGSLHEVPAVRLGAKVLESLRDRNGIDTAKVDDIIFGCVDPVGEAGAVIPRSAAFEAGYDFKAPGIQISRFCASGLDASTPSAFRPIRKSRRSTTSTMPVTRPVLSMARLASSSAPGRLARHST